MIYPEYFPLSRTSEHAEKKVFEELKKVSGSYDIFYHKKIVAYQKISCEIDFVIMDRNKSILLMEVKGGPVTYKDGVWKSYDEIIDPLEQIEKNKRIFINKYDLSNKILVDFCLCFPDADLAAFPDSLQEYQVIQKSQLYNLEKSISHSFKMSREHLSKIFPWVPAVLDTRDYSRILKNIEGEVKYHIPLSKKVESEDSRIKELTEDQYTVYECCVENNRIVVNGVAGSGKTILGQKIAREYHEKGASVLLLCYNIMLGNSLESQCMAYNKKRNETENLLTVKDCHSYLKEVIADKFIYNKIGKESTSEERSLFYEIEVPIKLEEEIDEDLIDAEMYDVLIIDEAQDFNEYILTPIFRLVKPGGKIILLRDEKQALFKQNFIPDVSSFFKIRLKKNLRNTKSILNYINNTLQTHLLINEKNPEGELVEEKTFRDNDSQLKELTLKINQLVTKENISPENIMILYPEKIREQHCLYNIDKLGQLDLRELPDNLVREKGCIYKTRITKFKGLDAAFLFIPNFELFTGGSFNENYLYTILTRARNRLYVFEVENLIQ